MWNAIALVTSGLTLVAFIVAVAAWVYRQRSMETERLIRTAPDHDRAVLISKTLATFDVKTEGLTKQQQYEIALAQIHDQGARFRWICVVVAIIATLLATIAIFAVSRPWETSSGQPAGTSVTSTPAKPVEPAAPPPLDDASIVEVHAFDLHRSDFVGRRLPGSEARTIRGLPTSGLPEEKAVAEVVDWAAERAEAMFSPATSPDTVSLLMSSGPGSSLLQISSDFELRDMAVYYWMFSEAADRPEATSKVHGQMGLRSVIVKEHGALQLDGDLAPVLNQAKSQGQDAVHLHIDKPGYELQLISIPLAAIATGIHKQILLKKAPGGLAVAVKDSDDESKRASILRSRLEKKGFKVQSPGVFEDLKRTRSGRFVSSTNPDYLLSELAQDRLNIIILIR